MVNRLHYLRIDQETRKDIPVATAKAFIETAQTEVPKVDAIVLSDYDRGVIGPALIDGIVSAAAKGEQDSRGPAQDEALP